MEVTTKTPKRSALDLYGGKDKVTERVSDLIREGLIKKLGGMTERGRKAYIGYLVSCERISEQRINEFMIGEIKADYKTFLIFKSSLRLSLEDALGEPDLSDTEIREYWENQRHTKPMRIIAGHGDKIPEDPIDIKSYVCLRAIGEIYRLAGN